MERDFRRHAGASPDEVIADLDRLVAAAGAGVPVDAAVTARLLRYYDRYEKLARDHTRDPAELQRARSAIAAWRDDVGALERALVSEAAS